MILKKLLESIFQFFQYKVRRTTLCLLFTFMFTFTFELTYVSYKKTKNFTLSWKIFSAKTLISSQILF